MAAMNAPPPARLKVLHVIETLGAGGAEQVLVNVLPELSSLGVDCELAVLWPPYTLAEQLENRGVSVHRLDLKSRWNPLRTLLFLGHIVREKQITHLHAHLFFSMFHAAVSRPFFPRLHRVLTFQNQTFIGFPAATLWKKARRRGESWLTEHCFDYLTAVSDLVGDHYSEQLGIDRASIHYVPNGVPLTLAPNNNLDLASVRQQYHVPAEALLIVVPARLIEQKGHIYLFNALLELRSRGCAPVAKVVGKGPLRDSLMSLVQERGLGAQVEFLPTLPHSALFPLIQAADLVVMPSLFEGFSLAQCECMLLERAVVSTRVGGPIVDGESGVLVPPRDVQALATAIYDLAQDSDKRVRLGKAARQRIINEFSAARVAADYLDIYRQLAQSTER
jgi:glycosyltransferase involved in cell wall biosynthesis